MGRRDGGYSIQSRVKYGNEICHFARAIPQRNHGIQCMPAGTGALTPSGHELLRREARGSRRAEPRYSRGWPDVRSATEYREASFHQ